MSTTSIVAWVSQVQLDHSEACEWLREIFEIYCLPPNAGACGGSPSTRGGSLTSATVPPHNSLPTLSLQSLGRFCQAAVSLVGAPPVYVQCISRILVGQGDHGDPPPPQHAWSFTGSNKPTLYSKEKFGSNKPAFRQWHFKPFWVKTTWALRFTGGSQAHNISTTQ